MINLPLRWFLAALPPTALYTLGYWVTSFWATPSFAFFSSTPWLAILGITLLYPLNSPFLWMVFRPLEKWLNSKTRQVASPPETNPFLRGNFAAVHDELAYEVTDIKHGKIPKDVSGAWVKTGANPEELHESGAYHWFDGDSMFHVFRLKNGTLHYCNKRILAEVGRKTIERGVQTATTLGSLQGFGVLQGPLSGLKRKVGYGDRLEPLKEGTPNTAVTYFQKQILGLLEVNLPYHVKLNEGKDGLVTIDEKGHQDYQGQLLHAVSAHPKVDRKTNEFFAFCYNIRSPKANLTVFDSKLRKTNSVEFPTICPRMLHDFCITENFAIVPDLPMEFNPQRAIKEGDFIVHHNPSGKSRFGFHPRSSSNSADTIWISTPGLPFFFHVSNSWEETSASGDQLVIVCAGVALNLDAKFPGVQPLLDYQTRFEKLTFNLSKRLFEGRQVLIPDYSMEFPTIEQQLVGYKNRYSYMPFVEPTDDRSNEALDNTFFRGFFKYDHQEERVAAKIMFGSTHTAGEVFFQRRDGADPSITSENEDDGYLMTAVHDWTTGESEFVMWDASTVGRGGDQPILRAGLKQRVPNGFHTMFVPESDLDI